MNRARDKENKKVDISKLEKGSKELMEIAKKELYCYDENCKTELILCSYMKNNIPPPYFRTKKINGHKKGCKESIDIYREWDGKITKRRHGMSAFNLIGKRYYGEIVNYSTYHKSENNAINKIYNNKNTMQMGTRSAVGPILCDYDTILEEGVTYIYNVEKCSYKETGNHKWLNLKDIGMGIDIETPISQLSTFKIAFFVKKIFNKNGRKFCFPIYHIIENNKIIYSKYE